jgi:hypothetical protein
MVHTKYCGKCEVFEISAIAGTPPMQRKNLSPELVLRRNIAIRSCEMA